MSPACVGKDGPCGAPAAGCGYCISHCGWVEQHGPFPPEAGVKPDA